jgi:hypothetical protein
MRPTLQGSGTNGFNWTYFLPTGPILGVTTLLGVASAGEDPKQLEYSFLQGVGLNAERFFIVPEKQARLKAYNMDG